MQVSFSRLKKKVKDKVSKSKRKPDRTGDESGRERADGSLSRSVPHIVTDGGLDRGDSGSYRDGRQVHSTNTTPTPEVPEPVPARGGDDDQEGEGGGVEEGEGGGFEEGQVSRGYSHLLSDLEIAAGSGPGQGGNGADEEKVGQAHPSPSAPSNTQSGNSDVGM